MYFRDQTIVSGSLRRSQKQWNAMEKQWNWNYKKVTKINGRSGLGEEVDRLRCSNFKDLTRKIFQLVFWLGGHLLREVR